MSLFEKFGINFRCFVQYIKDATFLPIDFEGLVRTFTENRRDFKAMLDAALFDYSCYDFGQLIDKKTELHFLQVLATSRDGEGVLYYFNEQAYEKCSRRYGDLDLEFFGERLSKSVLLHPQYAYLLEERYSVNSVQARCMLVALFHNEKEQLSLQQVDARLFISNNEYGIKNLQQWQKYFFPRHSKLSTVLHLYCLEDMEFEVKLKCITDPTSFKKRMRASLVARQYILDVCDRKVVPEKRVLDDGYGKGYFSWLQ